MPEIVGTLRPPRLASAPASPARGEMYYDSPSDTLYWWDGTSWVSGRGGSSATVNATVAKASAAGIFAVPTGIPAATAMDFDAVEYQSSAGIIDLAANTFTIPADGYYEATALWYPSPAMMASPATMVSLIINLSGSRVGETRQALVGRTEVITCTAQFYANAGQVLSAAVGHNQGSSQNTNVGNAAIHSYLALSRLGGPKGDKGDPGPITEYALQTGSGASTSAPTTTWTKLPLGAVSAKSADADSCLRWNADGTVTILQDGWYSIYAQVAGVGVTSAGVQWGIWRDATDTSPANPSPSFRRELPAETFFTDALTHVFYYVAGYRLGVSLYNRGTAVSFSVFGSVSRVAAGAKGDTGPSGPMTSGPIYNENTLPISATDGTIARFTYTTAPSGSVYLVLFNGGVWYTLGEIPMLDTGETAPTNLVAGTGWRMTDKTVTVPMRGNYLWSCSAVVVYNVAEAIGGIGIASASIAATATPTFSSTNGQGSANHRVMNIVSQVRGTYLANEVISLRVNSNVSATIQFARARIWAVPIYLWGVV